MNCTMNVWVTYYARQERTLRAGAIGSVRTLFEPSVRHFTTAHNTAYRTTYFSRSYLIS